MSNDSGIRLLEAHYPKSLSQFFESNKNEPDDDHEAHLVFWNEIDGQFPQFSPLFYVQANIFIYLFISFLFNEVHVEVAYVNSIIYSCFSCSRLLIIRLRHIIYLY